MWNLDVFKAIGSLFLCAALEAESPAPLPTPALQPGEALAIAPSEGAVRLYGDTGREYPIGSLAKLVWLRMEGDDWVSAGLEYQCTGSDGANVCWLRKGHGRVDLVRALRESCNLAFLAWARLSAEEWKHQLGDGVARFRLEEHFGPFLGNRLPPGDAIPPMTIAWVGDGDLLRATPEGMLKWLTDPAQEYMLAKCRRYLGLAFGKDESWWVKTGTGPIVGEPGATSAWVVGGNGQTLVVLHLPRGRGRVEGLLRFRQLMGLK